MNTPLAPNQQPQKKTLSSADAGVQNANQSFENGEVRAQALQINTSGEASSVLEGMTGGEIRESVRAGSEIKGDSSGGGNVQQDDDTQQEQEAIADQLAEKEALPTPKVMARKVKHGIAQEMQQVKKQVKKFQKNAVKYAYELSEALQKLRNLRNLLANIAMYAVEVVQRLYERLMSHKPLATVEIEK